MTVSETLSKKYRNVLRCLQLRTSTGAGRVRGRCALADGTAAEAAAE